MTSKQNIFIMSGESRLVHIINAGRLNTFANYILETTN